MTSARNEQQTKPPCHHEGVRRKRKTTSHPRVTQETSVTVQNATRTCQVTQTPAAHSARPKAQAPAPRAPGVRPSDCRRPGLPASPAPRSPGSALGFGCETRRGRGARAGRRLLSPQPGPRPPASPRPGPRRARRPRGTSRPPPASSLLCAPGVPGALPARWPPLPVRAPPGQVYTPEDRRLYGFPPPPNWPV